MKKAPTGTVCPGGGLVGDIGFEPMTSSVSGKRGRYSDLRVRPDLRLLMPVLTIQHNVRQPADARLTHARLDCTHQRPHGNAKTPRTADPKLSASQVSDAGQG